MKKLFVVLIIFISSFGFSQDFSLDKIKLKDSVLLSELKTFIEETKVRTEMFVDKGYVAVRLLYVNEESIKGELKHKYSITDQYYRPKSEYSILPSYYCYLNDKLVFFYDSMEDTYIKPKYKRKTKRKLSKLLKPYFDKPIHLKVRDSTGKLIINDKDFVEEAINLHGGITLFIYADGKTKITTYWDQFNKNKKEDRD